MPFDKGKKRKLIDACGHERCYSCMFRNEACPHCQAQKEPNQPGHPPQHHPASRVQPDMDNGKSAGFIDKEDFFNDFLPFFIPMVIRVSGRFGRVILI